MDVVTINYEHLVQYNCLFCLATDSPLNFNSAARKKNRKKKNIFLLSTNTDFRKGIGNIYFLISYSVRKTYNCIYSIYSFIYSSFYLYKFIIPGKSYFTETSAMIYQNLIVYVNIYYYYFYSLSYFSLDC